MNAILGRPRRTRRVVKTLAIIAICAQWVAAVGAAKPREPVTPGSRTATATAEAFSDAIARGDAASVRALLLPGVLIFESGEAEDSADAYAGHHLPADITFMARMTREVLSQRSGGNDASSWVATKSRVRGQYKGKAVDLDTTETVVLVLTGSEWRIAHIHWSSSTHREPRTAS